MICVTDVILALIMIMVFGRHSIVGTFEVLMMRSPREGVVKTAEAGSHE